MLPNSLRQHPNYKEGKFLVSFSGFFFQVRVRINPRIRKFHIADVEKQSVLQEESRCFAHKTNRFGRSRFLCRRGLTFHSR